LEQLLGLLLGLQRERPALGLEEEERRDWRSCPGIHSGFVSR
jgi:hypothetical protein